MYRESAKRERKEVERSEEDRAGNVECTVLLMRLRR